MKKEYLHVYIRRCMLVLFILIVAMIQNTAHMFPTIFGARAFLLIPVVVCISMFEKNISSTLYGAFAGLLWDISSGASSGFNTIILLLISTTCGFLINYLMRNNMVTATLLTSFALILYNFIYWMAFVFPVDKEGCVYLLLRFYLPSCAYSLALMPPIYILIRHFLKRLRRKFPVQRRLTRNK